MGMTSWNARLIATKTTVLGLGMLLAGFSATSFANGEVSLGQARRAAAAALQQCRQDGLKVSVAVVDRAGDLIVLLKDNGVRPLSIDGSIKKAYTAANLRNATSQLAQAIAANPALAGLRDFNDNVLILAGGLPITVGGDVVGGIGVGGAPSGLSDEACARAGLEAVMRGGSGDD